MKHKWIVYRIQEEGQRLDPISVMFIPKWVPYTYLHPNLDFATFITACAFLLLV